MKAKSGLHNSCGRLLHEAQQARPVQVCRSRNTNKKYNRVSTVAAHKTSYFHAMVC
jgi:hypothetical protein